MSDSAMRSMAPMHTPHPADGLGERRHLTP